MARDVSIRPFFFRYFNRYHPHWIAGFFAIVGTVGFSVITPLIIKQAIDSLEAGEPLSVILKSALLIVGIRTLSAICRFFTRRTIIAASRKVEYDVRNDLFSHLLTLDRYFYEKTPTGDLMSRATNDLEAVRAVYGPGFLHFTSTFLTSVMSFVLMYRLDSELTLYCFGMLPLLTVTVLLIGKQVHRRYRKIQEHLARISAFVQENLSGIRVIASFVQEKNQIDSFDDLNRDFIRKNMSMVKAWGLFFPVLSLIGGGVLVLIILAGGRRVINGQLTLGTLVAFVAYLEMLVWPMIGLGWVIGIFQQGLVSMGRIQKILDRKPLITSKPSATHISGLKGDIEFKNLTFSYDDSSSPALKNISCRISSGSTVAVVGPTGSGKSTLVSLLTRLYTVPEGSIFIDGLDINSIDLEFLRSSVGFIPQESFLFSETISGNIAFGTDSRNGIENVREAAEIADIAKDVYSFPDEFETMLGERGITLSGGQKQRASIARAIIKQPPILIFDDAFSSVDADTEERILLRLKDQFRARTVFVISHRISSIQDSDMILVLKDGRLVESGTHYSLLAGQGVYAEMHRRQALTDELALM